MSRQSRRAFWLKQAADQRRWIAEHGGNLAGYVARYGHSGSLGHYGNGGEAIFKADFDALLEYERRAELAR